jgi:hypothetical protein
MNKNKNSLVQEFILGGSSSGAACLFTHPIDLIKVRKQLQGEQMQTQGKASSIRIAQNVKEKIEIK